MLKWIRKHVWDGYSAFERAFLWGMVAMQIAVFVIAPDTPLSIIAGIAGVISVVMCAKGRVAFYGIGFVQTISYLVLAWQNRFYGEVMENVFYLVTMVWGLIDWHITSETTENGAEVVKSRKFGAMQWAVSAAVTLIGTVTMGAWLEGIGSQQAYTDAATNVLAIIAQILMVRRYREQWLWWIVIDLLCIKLWWVAGNWSMVAMYVGWTINCIYGWVNWTQLERKNHG